MMKTKIYIVAWTDKPEAGRVEGDDHYEIFSEHDYDDAENAADRRYRKVIEDGAYCASISKMTEGTDWF